MKKILLLLLTISLSCHGQDYIIIHGDTINASVTKFYKFDLNSTTFSTDFVPFVDFEVDSKKFSIPAKQITKICYQGELLNNDDLIEKINLLSKKIPNIRLVEMKQINLKIKSQEAIITGGVFLLLSGACLITNIAIQNNAPNLTTSNVLSISSGVFLSGAGLSFIIGGKEFIKSVRLR